VGIAANWSRENLAWAAGIFEGEGCISASSSGRKRVRLSVNMTDEDVIRRLHAVMGVGDCYGPYVRPGKPSWQWEVTSAEDVQAVLAAFWTFLCSRRKGKAEEAIRIAASMRKKQNAVWCLRGHRLEGDNVYMTKRGSRMCLACNRIRRTRPEKRAKNVFVELHQSPGGD
jgi:hypothetical protein